MNKEKSALEQMYEFTKSVDPLSGANVARKAAQIFDEVVIDGKPMLKFKPRPPYKSVRKPV